MPEIKRSYTRSNVKERGRSSFCIGLVSFLSILIFLLVFFTIPSTSFGARIKELAYIDGVRNN
ncbi:MAG TPA: hypothetical protein PKZ54_02910 [Syntrophorhabdaceae bacterium]|nr:hypothetical protein [Syntrophorhabdaceae bacterium]